MICSSLSLGKTRYIRYAWLGSDADRYESKQMCQGFKNDGIGAVFMYEPSDITLDEL